MSRRSTERPAPQGQMGSDAPATPQPQQSGSSGPAPQQGSPAPDVRYTDWASI